MADPEVTKGQDVGGDVDPALLSEEEGLAYMDALRASLAGNIAEPLLRERVQIVADIRRDHMDDLRAMTAFAEEVLDEVERYEIELCFLSRIKSVRDHLIRNAEATAEFRAYSAHATAVERAENGIKKIVANVEDARAYLAAVAAGDIVEPQDNGDDDDGGVGSSGASVSEQTSTSSIGEAEAGGDGGVRGGTQKKKRKGKRRKNAMDEAKIDHLLNTVIPAKRAAISEHIDALPAAEAVYRATPEWQKVEAYDVYVESDWMRPLYDLQARIDSLANNGSDGDGRVFETDVINAFEAWKGTLIEEMVEDAMERTGCTREAAEADANAVEWEIHQGLYFVVLRRSERGNTKEYTQTAEGDIFLCDKRTGNLVHYIEVKMHYGDLGKADYQITRNMGMMRHGHGCEVGTLPSPKDGEEASGASDTEDGVIYDVAYDDEVVDMYIANGNSVRRPLLRGDQLADVIDNPRRWWIAALPRRSYVLNIPSDIRFKAMNWLFLPDEGVDYSWVWAHFKRLLLAPDLKSIPEIRQTYGRRILLFPHSDPHLKNGAGADEDAT